MNIEIYRCSEAKYGISEDVIEYDILTFSGGERHVQFKDVNHLQPNEQQTQNHQLPYVYVLARLLSPTDIIDLILLCNVINQYDNKLILEIPYLPYARQDRVCADGQAFSIRELATIIARIYPLALYIWDVHSEVSIDELRQMMPLCRVVNVTPYAIISKSEKLVGQFQLDDAILVCPDEGAISRSKELRKRINPTMPIVNCSKVRDPLTGHITDTIVGEAHFITGEFENIENKVAIIPDDICDGGYTFIKIAEKLKERGVRKIILYVTHGIFSKSIAVFHGLFDEVYYSNSREGKITSPQGSCEGMTFKMIKHERKYNDI